MEVWARCGTFEVKSGGSCNCQYKLFVVDDVSFSLENKHSNDPALISKITKLIRAVREPPFPLQTCQALSMHLMSSYSKWMESLAFDRYAICS